MPLLPSGQADLLQQLRKGDRAALDQVVATVYQELREIAHRHRIARDWYGEGTLATTAVVHEAYLRLAEQSGARWNDRAHFLALAAVAMRHVLADSARARARLKRGGGDTPVPLEEALVAQPGEPELLLQVHDAVGRLALLDPRLASVVECRFFGSLTNAEIAEALGVTERTVERDWTKARMILRPLLAA